jgi:hypothetical protein
MDDQTESDERILTFDVPDEALERAASDSQGFRNSSGSFVIFAAVRTMKQFGVGSVDPRRREAAVKRWPKA